MICTNCGYDVADGTLFCTNCGASLANSHSEDIFADASPAPQELGASLEAAVQANKDTIDSIEARAQAQVDAAFNDFPPIENADVSEGFTAPSYGADATSGSPASNQWQVAPEPPAGFEAGQFNQPAQGAQPGAQAYAAPAAAAVGAAGAAPFYQGGANPNAHYSSQRTYDNNPYGESTGQAPGYQQPYREPSYNRGADAQSGTQAWGVPSNTERCLAMVLYIGGLIAMIIGLCVRDKDDPFIAHHLNNVVVIFIGCIIGWILSFVLIGGILLLYLLVMTIMGMVSAYNGDMRELPLIGKIRLIQ